MIYIFKHCTCCGTYYECLPEFFKCSDERGISHLIFFECLNCQSTLTVKTQLVLDQALGNAWTTQSEAA